MLQAANKKVALVKSDRDTRYSKNEITTHDGLARPCHAVGSLAELRATVGEEYANIEVIAIDEAQFFPDLLSFCTEASDHDQKQIVVAGLDGDFQRHRFGQVSKHISVFLFCTWLHNLVIMLISKTSGDPIVSLLVDAGTRPYTGIGQRHQAKCRLCLLW